MRNNCHRAYKDIKPQRIQRYKQNTYIGQEPMEKFKGNKGLLDKKRFEWLEKQREQRLRKLTRKKAIQLEEKMLSSKLILEWRRNFTPDKPVCLKMSLRSKRTKR